MQKSPAQRCLIVDDSNFDQRMMARTLSKLERPIDILFAATLDDARQLLRLGHFALILLDNTLPDGKGANFALELSEHEDWAQIPVIIVSDWPSPFMWQKAKQAGVAHVVNKSDFGPELVARTLPEPAALH